MRRSVDFGHARGAWEAPVLVFCGAREWRNRQTRTVQVRVPERAWGFNSPLAHHDQSASGQRQRSHKARSSNCWPGHCAVRAIVLSGMCQDSARPIIAPQPLRSDTVRGMRPSTGFSHGRLFRANILHNRAQRPSRYSAGLPGGTRPGEICRVPVVFAACRTCTSCERKPLPSTGGVAAVSDGCASRRGRRRRNSGYSRGGRPAGRGSLRRAFANGFRPFANGFRPFANGDRCVGDSLA